MNKTAFQLLDREMKLAARLRQFGVHIWEIDPKARQEAFRAALIERGMAGRVAGERRAGASYTYADVFRELYQSELA